MQTRELVTAALLAALAMVIPLALGGVLTLAIPPFTATVASHVPVMLAMAVSPFAAVMSGLGSALGFFLRLGSPVVAARAAVHAVFGLAGALLIRRGFRLGPALLLILPLHALGEALVVLPFGWTLAKAGLVVAVGTALHHLIDAVIALVVVRFIVLPRF
ncbi:MAG: ECF transporter S component [Bacillota bacterium]|nr:ECF transporter S component [Bacillota bacterium]